MGIIPEVLMMSVDEEYGFGTKHEIDRLSQNVGGQSSEIPLVICGRVDCSATPVNTAMARETFTVKRACETRPSNEEDLVRALGAKTDRDQNRDRTVI